jgi:hypothetical protein
VAGAAGDGGFGADAGLAAAIEFANAVVAEFATLDTIAQIASSTGSAGGAAGLPGSEGAGGLGGAGLAPADGNADGPPGADGAPGAMGLQGDDGEDGSADGVVASLGSDVTVRNNVLALGSPVHGVALVAEDGLIDSDFNFFDGVGVLSLGNVALGSRDREEDPLFIDPMGGDFRIGPDSPAIDAGDNDFLPAGIVRDLGGEPRPVDDPATPDTGEGGGAPVVDAGAFEFQPPRCDTDPEMLWPPNHKYVVVAVDVDLGTTAALDPDVSFFASSSEPDNGIGDGNTTGDVNGSDGFGAPVDITSAFDGDGEDRNGAIELRSERSGPGQGRLYTVEVRLEGDDFDPRATHCFVEVPHDQGDAG